MKNCFYCFINTFKGTLPTMSISLMNMKLSIMNLVDMSFSVIVELPKQSRHGQIDLWWPDCNLQWYVILRLTNGSQILVSYPLHSLFSPCFRWSPGPDIPKHKQNEIECFWRIHWLHATKSKLIAWASRVIITPGSTRPVYSKESTLLFGTCVKCVHWVLAQFSIQFE